MCEIKDKVINCCNCNETENLIKSINVYRYEDGKKYRIVRYDFTKDKEIKLYLYLTELHMMENHTLENYNKNIAVSFDFWIKGWGMATISSGDSRKTRGVLDY